jgi:hypothetical protein
MSQQTGEKTAHRQKSRLTHVFDRAKVLREQMITTFRCRAQNLSLIVYPNPLSLPRPISKLEGDKKSLVQLELPSKITFKPISSHSVPTYVYSAGTVFQHGSASQSTPQSPDRPFQFALSGSQERASRFSPPFGALRKSSVGFHLDDTAADAASSLILNRPKAAKSRAPGVAASLSLRALQARQDQQQACCDQQPDEPRTSTCGRSGSFSKHLWY